MLVQHHVAPTRHQVARRVLAPANAHLQRFVADAANVATPGRRRCAKCVVGAVVVAKKKKIGCRCRDQLGWYRWKPCGKEGEDFNLDRTGFLVTRIRELKKMLGIEFHFSGLGAEVDLEVNRDHRTCEKHDDLVVLIAGWCHDPITLVPGLSHLDLQYAGGVCDKNSSSTCKAGGDSH